MEYTEDIKEEIKNVYSGDFVLGESIYMGMGKANGRTVCIAVAYKIDYCFKKATQFEEDVPTVTFTHINKVRVGEMAPSIRFDIEKKLVL